ncbi:MAG: sulfatase-like hydrolase/transferase [Edaphobacter sp.]|uniref:sulfatase family protein n=1 Tax=Edaphobacter sp. TaxID=1934404 RepID=UPI00238CBE37|nr:sulfatase-like hydrolase/transferase [Edaphobacter sp.]MDE1176335.1 sulfatase-like hydrolase/transferase [Edaphobacter sp.]
MNRRDVIKNALLSAGAISAGSAMAQEVSAQAAQKRVPHESYPSPPRKTNGERMPNVLWVCTDQQRFDTLAGLSNSLIKTPNLQKFMSESVTFTNTFCQTPICSPSRGSFLSGRYPHVTGLRANGQRIRPTERLVTRILADNQYTCGLVGKLHLSPCLGGRVEDRIDDGYEVFKWSHDISDQWPLKNEWYNWLAKEGVKIPKAPPGHVWGMPIDPKYTQTAWCADSAIDFMRQQRDFNPWLMSVNIFQPHHPFYPTEEYLHRYNPKDMPTPAYREGELANKPVFQTTDHRGAYGGGGISFEKTSPQEHLEITAAYYAMIEQVDTDMGRMMHALEESGQADNTIVIFMSDHGEMLGDHGMYLKGPYFYDCLTRVPLIVRWPGHFKQGLKVDALVELVDIAPTLVEAAGIPVPSGMQGRSLMPLLTGQTTQHRDSVYMEYFDANATYEIPPMLTSVRTDKWKLNYCDKPRTGELYDLEKDPGEFNNLWDDAHARDARERMMHLLVGRMIETTDPLPERHTSW